ncbi:hypothetical protein [Bowmanella dokdonensis]|uniref:Uncharacterized protein n=1 Tax=Bowmanella dokdonensis TaxID=751969 RepID=A0A939IRB5_9ALTE|nr:hypothetical protein [Bowmanella dokdonensis]MBN7825331.1 hypothetical protein [Bowmanella dokdonensis]
MNPFRALYRALLRRKFRSRGLAIIQAIPRIQFDSVIETCLQEGWEKGRLYEGTDSWRKDGRLSLRKGTSTLEFERNEDQGQITGPRPAIEGLARRYDLAFFNEPQY